MKQKTKFIYFSNAVYMLTYGKCFSKDSKSKLDFYPDDQSNALTTLFTSTNRTSTVHIAIYKCLSKRKDTIVMEI